MNDIIYDLIQQAKVACVDEAEITEETLDKFGKEFARLLVSDILRVVAAQVLFHETAEDVYQNLHRLYK
jgi:hypothetical protein